MNMRLSVALILICVLLPGLCGCQHTSGVGAAKNPIPYSANPHYLADAGGRPLLLIGDYTWGTFSDTGYDYKAMLEEIAAHKQNLARVWLWWGSGNFPEPHNKTHISPYLRPGPGTANDGLPKYDLDQFSPAFFERLQHVCKAARDRGITLQLVLFDAWMIKHGNLWKLHAYCRDNNVNGVDGDPAKTGKGMDGKHGFCSMGNPASLERQKAYIRRVISAVDRFENVLFEIANENFYNKDWEGHLCEYIHEYEKDRPQKHLVMPLDLPNHGYGGIQTYDLRKMHRQILKALALNQPIIFDTDGLGNPDDSTVRKAMWTAFVSGANTDYLDDSMQPDGKHHGNFRGTSRETLRRQLGCLSAFAHKTRFWEMHAADNRLMSGFGFVFASDREMVAYFPEGGASILDLSLHKVARARWYNPRNGEYRAIPYAGGTGPLAFLAPSGDDWVLCIRMR
jgi:hypothetical protein